VSDEVEPIVIADGFPKDIATTFSGFIREQFPDIKSMSVKQLKFNRVPTMVAVTGSQKDSIKKALDWALRSCDGKGLKQYLPADTLPLIEARKDKAAGEILGMQSYTAKVEAYIQARLARTLSAKEVKALHEEGTYLTLRINNGIPVDELAVLLRLVKSDDVIFSTLVDHVANRTIADMQTRYTQNQNSNVPETTPKRSVLPSDQYRSIRKAKAFADTFGKAVDAVITDWQKTNRVPRQPRVIHTTVSAPPIRNTGKYLYKLNLADVGVTNRSFTSGLSKRDY